MGLIDYMILSERFQGVRRDCVRPSLVDVVILLKCLAPIALLYLFGVRLLVGFNFTISCACFICLYAKREEKVLSAIYDESGSRYPMRR